MAWWHRLVRWLDSGSLGSPIRQSGGIEGTPRGRKAGVVLQLRGEEWDIRHSLFVLVSGEAGSVRLTRVRCLLR